MFDENTWFQAKINKIDTLTSRVWIENQRKKRPENIVAHHLSSLVNEKVAK